MFWKIRLFLSSDIKTIFYLTQEYFMLNVEMRRILIFFFKNYNWPHIQTKI